ncbi:hypothetical protein Tco_0400408 [Tanacetum coccineum]
MTYYNMTHRYSYPYDWANRSRHERCSFIDKILLDETPRMPDRLIYLGDEKDLTFIFRELEIIIGEELKLMELYEVVCKAEDDLRANPDKKNKRKAHDKDNDGRSEKDKEIFRRKARIVAMIFAVQHQARKMMNLKLHQRREVYTEDDEWDRVSDFGIWDLKPFKFL